MLYISRYFFVICLLKPNNSATFFYKWDVTQLISYFSAWVASVGDNDEIGFYKIEVSTFIIFPMYLIGMGFFHIHLKKKETSIYSSLKILFVAPNQHSYCSTILCKFLLAGISLLSEWSLYKTALFYYKTTTTS